MGIYTKRIICLILIILNCITIFYFSHQISDNSSKQSSKIVEIISVIIPSIKNMEETNKTILKQEVLTPIIRKMAHFSIYTVLGIFAINFTITLKDKKIYIKMIYALIFCFIYAITDEFHQRFIPGRSAEVRDVIIDTIGALTGILVTILIIKILSKVKSKLKYNKK